MIDRDALIIEMRKASWDTTEDWDETSADVALRHIASARAEALEEAAMACNKIHSRYSLTGNAEQVSAWVTSNYCKNAIRALAQSATPETTEPK